MCGRTRASPKPVGARRRSLPRRPLAGRTRRTRPLRTLWSYLADAEVRLSPSHMGSTAACSSTTNSAVRAWRHHSEANPPTARRLPKSQKRHVFAAGRAAFAWMERRHLIDRSPFSGSKFRQITPQGAVCSPMTSFATSTALRVQGRTFTAHMALPVYRPTPARDRYLAAEMDKRRYHRIPCGDRQKRAGMGDPNRPRGAAILLSAPRGPAPMSSPRSGRLPQRPSLTAGASPKHALIKRVVSPTGSSETFAERSLPRYSA